MRTGGVFYFPWHRHQIEGPTTFSVSSEKDWESRVNGIAKVPKRTVLRSGIRTRPGTVQLPVQANALTHSVAVTLGISALLIFRCSSRSGGLLRNNIFVFPKFKDNLLIKNHTNCLCMLPVQSILKRLNVFI